MHISTKIALILGGVLFLGGGALLVIGIGDTVDGAREVETDNYATTQSDGSFTVAVNGTWDVEVYVIHPANCNSLELSVTDSTGAEVMNENSCYLMSDTERGMEGPVSGSEEFYSSFAGKNSMEYTFSSNVNLNIRGTDCDAECKEAIEGGILSSLGGAGALCCGIVFLVIGGILALVMDAPRPLVMMPTGQGNQGQFAQGQVMYQAPVGSQPVQQMNQPPTTPVAPITPPLVQQPTTPAAPITPPLSDGASKSPWDP